MKPERPSASWDAAYTLNALIHRFTTNPGPRTQLAMNRTMQTVDVDITKQTVDLKVNGRLLSLQIDPRTSLLDALREHLHLTGTKKGCDHGQCGACTVLINGRRINSCLTLAVMHDDDDIVTIEGLSAPEALHPLQAAFIERDAFQCGYCTPGGSVRPSVCSPRRRRVGL